MSKSAFQGVHPNDRKHATSGLPIETLPVKEGEEFFMSLTQHLGAPAKPVVTKGQEVRAGELIAESGGFISANIHSPVDGVVVSIGEMDYPVSGIAPCIVIKAGAEQKAPVAPEDNGSLADLAKAAGIVGMGGAAFPTHVKLSPKEKLHTLIINGVECEPYLTCDHRQMLERSEELIQGAMLVKEALQLEKVIIGIEGNKPDAAKALEDISNGRVEVRLLPMLYPQGGEKQLIVAVLGKEVPDGQLPSAIGVIVDNVSTILALYDAKVNKLPLIRRVVTVTGDVKNPKNIIVPLGTPLSRLIDYCGGTDKPIEKVIMGGPMTGFAAHSLSIASYKGMNGIIVATEPLKPEVETLPCIRCGKCVRACPINLSPVMLENFYKAKMFDELYEWKVLSCIECSACNFACPSSRPLKNIFKLGKKEARDIMMKKNAAK